MKYIVDNNQILVSIDKDEPINATILNICIKEKINFGWINGIGAIYDPEIGYFNTIKKDYVKDIINGEFELTSLIGNITIKEESLFVHSHITFTDTKFRAYGGHLFDCKIAAAGEFIIWTGKKKIIRDYSAEVGLYLWHCKI